MPLSGWSNAKDHVIDASADGALTDYVVRVRVNYGSGTDADWDVYCSSLCNTDFSDIRFTDTANVALNFALVEKTDSSFAIFDVQTDVPSPAGATIRVHYGNAGASSASDPANTYLFYDALSSLTGWTTSGSTWSISTGGGPNSEDVFKYVNTGADGLAYKSYAGETYIAECQFLKESAQAGGGYGGVLGGMVNTSNWARPGHETWPAGTTTPAQIRINAAGTPTNYAQTAEDLTEDTWYKHRAYYHVARDAAFGSDVNFTISGGRTLQGLEADGTSIWTTEHTTNRVARWNYAGTLQDSSTSLPSPASGNFGGCALYDDGSTVWLYCVVLAAGTPSTTHIVRYDSTDLSVAEYVADISSTFPSPTGGNAIARRNNYWIIGQTGVTDTDFEQHIYVFNSAFSSLTHTISTGHYADLGYQDCVFVENNLYVTTHEGDLFCFRWNEGEKSVDLVEAFALASLPGNFSQGVAWDGAQLLVTILTTNGVRDIDLASGTNWYIGEQVVDPPNGCGTPYKKFTKLGTQASIGVGAFRNTRFFDLRLRPYTLNDPQHGAWTDVPDAGDRRFPRGVARGIKRGVAL